MKNGGQAVPSKNVTLRIRAQDSGSGVKRIALANEDNLSTINWIDWTDSSLVATELSYEKTKSWILTDNDGEKTVYLIVEDNDGNTTVVYNTPFRYIITYNFNGGSNGPTNGQKEVGKPYTISSTVPSLAGYDCEGWDTSSSATNVVYHVGDKYYDNADLSLYAKWIPSPNTPYKVEHYKANLSGIYELAETTNHTGTTNTQVTATPKSYSGFIENTSHPNRVVSGTVAADGSLTLRLYYDRNEYTVSLTKGTAVESVSGGGTYAFGAQVTVTCTLNSNYTESAWTNNVATVNNIRYKKTHTYSFVNWTGTSTSTSQTYTFTMPATNVTLTANGKDTEGQANRQRYTKHTRNPIYVKLGGGILDYEGWVYKPSSENELQNSWYCSITAYPDGAPYGVACIDVYAGTGRSVTYWFSTNGSSPNLGSGTVSDNHNKTVDFDVYSWDDI